MHQNIQEQRLRHHASSETTGRMTTIETSVHRGTQHSTSLERRARARLCNLGTKVGARGLDFCFWIQVQDWSRLQLHHRPQLLDIIDDLSKCFYLQESNRITTLAVHYMDSYLCSPVLRNGLECHRAYLLVKACFMIASKFSEIRCPNIEVVAAHPECHTVEQVKEMEREVLEVLGWSLHVSFPYDAIAEMVTILSEQGEDLRNCAQLACDAVYSGLWSTEGAVCPTEGNHLTYTPIISFRCLIYELSRRIPASRCGGGCSLLRVA